MSGKHIAQKSQVVSPFLAGDHKNIVKKTQRTKEPSGQLFPAGNRKTHCQENTTHKRAKWSAHFQQVITKHVVKKTQRTKEPRGQLFPAGDHKTQCHENTTHKRAKKSAFFKQVVTKHIVKKTQHTREPRGQSISSRWSQGCKEMTYQHSKGKHYISITIRVHYMEHRFGMYSKNTEGLNHA